jgi:hypothetical protein
MRTHAGVRRDVCKFLRTLSNRDTQAAGQAMRHFNQPVLLLWSTRSRHFPRRLAERMQAEWRHTALVWVDSAGVFLSLEHGPQLVSHILRFMAIDAGSPGGAHAGHARQGLSHDVGKSPQPCGVDAGVRVDQVHG